MEDATGDARPHFVVDSWTHKSVIVVLDALVLLESALMLSPDTNPFFSGADALADGPTPAFIAFVALQIVFLAATLVVAGGACARKRELVRLNRALFAANALNYAVYTLLFVYDAVGQSDAGAAVRALLALAAVLAAVLGELFCRSYAILLERNDLGEKLPTDSPSFARRKQQLHDGDGNDITAVV